MSSWMNRFVAGPDGGPTITLRLGETLALHAAGHPGLEPAGEPDVRVWSGQLLAWLEFLDVLWTRADFDDDPDLGMLVGWLDEDLDAAIEAADRTGVPA